MAPPPLCSCLRLQYSLVWIVSEIQLDEATFHAKLPQNSLLAVESISISFDADRSAGRGGVSFDGMEVHVVDPSFEDAHVGVSPHDFEVETAQIARSDEIMVFFDGSPRNPMPVFHRPRHVIWRIACSWHAFVVRLPKFGGGLLQSEAHMRHAPRISGRKRRFARCEVGFDRLSPVFALFHHANVLACVVKRQCRDWSFHFFP